MIPKNPITLWLNGIIRENAVKRFMDKNLPAYDRLTTSLYRNPEKNISVGGASDSSHLYNLGEDFVLVNANTREQVAEGKAKQIFDEFIKPAWEGYTYFGPSSETQGYHIHWNLDRSISAIMGFIALGVPVTAVGIWLYRRGTFKKIFKK